MRQHVWILVLMALSSISSTLCEEAYKQKTMNVSICLTVRDMKAFNMARDSSWFYFKLDLIAGTTFVTQAQDILQEQNLLTFEISQPVRQIQVWNYDTSKRIGTVFFKKISEKQTADLNFEKNNLSLKVEARPCQGSKADKGILERIQPADWPLSVQKSSLSTVASDISSEI